MEPFVETLKNKDTGFCIEDETQELDQAEFLVIGCKPSGRAIVLKPDTGMCLLDNTSTFATLSLPLRALFEEEVGSRYDTHKDEDWVRSLQLRFSRVIDRRISRVQEFIDQNLPRFPKEDAEISNLRYEAEETLNELRRSWLICGFTCANCELKCLHPHGHPGTHECFSDHRCHKSCDFLAAHESEELPQCSFRAGHAKIGLGFSHACNQSSHRCGKQCTLSGKRNCQEVCALKIGHEGTEHFCSSRAHYCGAKCSVQDVATPNGTYSCPNLCVIPCEDGEHDVHQCENKGACPLSCPIPLCRDRCQSTDHFHSLHAPSEHHFCG